MTCSQDDPHQSKEVTKFDVFAFIARVTELPGHRLKLLQTELDHVFEYCLYLSLREKPIATRICCNKCLSERCHLPLCKASILCSLLLAIPLVLITHVSIDAHNPEGFCDL